MSSASSTLLAISFTLLLSSSLEMVPSLEDRVVWRISLTVVRQVYLE